VGAICLERSDRVSDFNRDNNRTVWFEIPVVELERATAFHTAVLAVKVEKQSFDGFEFSVMEHADGNGGCLVPNPDEVTDKGPLLYLNVQGRIKDAVKMVQEDGGSVSQDVHPIGPHGFRDLVMDSEDNRMALHSEVDA